jgi:hypothetical protein
MLIKTYWAIGKIERAYRPLRRTYDIFREELDVRTDNKSILQIAVKALNNIARPNGLILTFFVFRAYLRINKDSPPFLALIQKAATVQKAIKMLQKNRAKVKINCAIKARNRPSSHDVFTLFFRSEVLV